MSNKVKFFLFMIFALAFGISIAAYAADGGPAKPVKRCTKDQIAFASGTATGTYGQMVPTLVEYCQEADICETDETQGGLDNANGVIGKKFDAGITQADTLLLLNMTDPDVKKNIKALLALHYSSVHIFTLRNGFVEKAQAQEKAYLGLSTKTVESINTVKINKIADLKGKTVGAWSSAVGTMELINHKLALGMKIVKVAKRPDGADMLRKGQIYAFVGMGGRPVDWVQSDKEFPGKEFSLVAFDPMDISTLTQTGVYTDDKLSYDNMGAFGVQTVKVKNEVVVRNITAGPLVAKLVALRACVSKHLEDIKNERGTHPAWNDVNDPLKTSWEAWAPPASIKK